MEMQDITQYQEVKGTYRDAGHYATIPRREHRDVGHYATIHGS